ncbi:MAG: hypothetical protein RLZ98_1212 [Pseudomonadota bacterium]|jgi:Flp pilus assembly pilin Flp
MAAANSNLVARFQNDERGAIAIIFALVLLPLLGIVSLAIDYGRALSVNSQLTTAADAATAAVLHKLPADADDLKPFVRRQLDANLPEHLKNLPFELTIFEKQRRIQLTMQTEVPTAIVAILGVQKLDVAIVSTQVIPKTPQLPTGLAGVAHTSPAGLQEAEAMLGRAARSLNNGDIGSSTANTPKPEDIQKLKDELNRQIKEALEKAGHGNVDFSAISKALGR